MTFPINLAKLSFPRDERLDALDEWRIAERRVTKRWEEYVTAARDEAPAAHSAYLAALDGEEAAAIELQRLSLRKAA
jgi:hypothetical protein